MKRVILGLATVAALSGCYTGESNKDKGSSERMKNALATIVTGISAQQTHGHSYIEATIERPWDFDSRMYGNTSPDSIDVHVEMPLINNRFIGALENGLLKGGQRKLMFDWGVVQTSPNTYEIKRAGFNGTLTLEVNNGSIRGSYSKPLALDYSFDGSIDSTGNYSMNIGIPFAFDWKVSGRVVKQ